MASAIVSKVQQQLETFLKEQAELVRGAENDVHSMKENFGTIKAVLADAEQKQVTDEPTRVWLSSLKDVSYDIDDVLDLWYTEIMKSKMEDEEEGSDHHDIIPFNLMEKVCSVIPVPCFPFPCFSFKQIVLRRDVALKIRELNGKLNKIATIINMLLGDQQSDEGGLVPFRKISIVGMGGMGKSTLAKLVYNDKEVKTHFEKRIWVCVSDPFDKTRVASAILESLEGKTPDLHEFTALLERIQGFVDGKKFLLVLDDVWSEESNKWEELLASLRCGSRESKILVTTRNENVARGIGSTIIQLGKLSGEESWSLFSRVAFFGRPSRERRNLEDISRKIVEKCKGLPLAIKTLGSLLRFKRREEDWRNVLCSEVWELKEAERDLLAPLLLSYHDLYSELKPCFLYCAIFPKDYLIDVDELIRLWMAQGYLGEKDMEMIGRQYFENLAARSFFQDFEYDEFGCIERCKMHDMVSDFAKFLAENEYVAMEVNDLEKEKMDNSSCSGARHLMVKLTRAAPLPFSFDGLMKLRSLLVVCKLGTYNAQSISILVDKLSCLRSLKLWGFPIQNVPMEVGKLIHLRLLDLSFSLGVAKELPETICELYNLQTLDITNCSRLEKLPIGIGKLINLRHLKNKYIHWSALMPKGIAKLRSLMTLVEFMVDVGGRVGETCNLGDLKNLKELRSIYIKGLGSSIDTSESKKAELQNLQQLITLGLGFEDWGKADAVGGTESDQEIIEALEPARNLEYLEISTYRGTTFPKWLMSLSELKKVTLSYCMICEHLPALGKLPLLECLELEDLESVEKLDQEFFGIETIDDVADNGRDNFSPSSSSTFISFPMLKSLKIAGMDELEEWDAGIIGSNRYENATPKITLMPCLQSPVLYRCPKLTSLPDWLLELPQMEMEITNCPILFSLYHPQIGMLRHKVSRHHLTLDVVYSCKQHNLATKFPWARQ